jgi:hypothetical protein
MSFEAGSLIKVLLGSNVAGPSDTPLNLLSCASGCSFAGDVQVVGGANGSFVLDPAGGMSFLLAAAVPEPGKPVLLLLGLLAMTQFLRGRLGSRVQPA